jgi:hypothetical protein
MGIGYARGEVEKRDFASRERRMHAQGRHDRDMKEAVPQARASREKTPDRVIRKRIPQKFRVSSECLVPEKPQTGMRTSLVPVYPLHST